jgi:hypothetical protein
MACQQPDRLPKREQQEHNTRDEARDGNQLSSEPVLPRGTTSRETLAIEEAYKPTILPMTRNDSHGDQAQTDERNGGVVHQQVTIPRAAVRPWAAG